MLVVKNSRFALELWDLGCDYSPDVVAWYHKRVKLGSCGCTRTTCSKSNLHFPAGKPAWALLPVQQVLQAQAAGCTLRKSLKQSDEVRG